MIKGGYHEFRLELIYPYEPVSTYLSILFSMFFSMPFSTVGVTKGDILGV